MPAGVIGFGGPGAGILHPRPSTLGVVPFTPTGFRNAGPLAASSTDTAVITFPLPAGSAAGDVCYLFVQGSSAGDTDLTDPSGWTRLGSLFLEIGANDMELYVWRRVLAGGDADPTITVDTAHSGSSLGIYGFVAGWTGIDNTTPEDATPVFSSSGSAATFAPTGITTVTADAVVVSVVVTDDDNSLAIAPTGDQSFNEWLSSSEYETLVGGDTAFGMADKRVAAPGAVTSPTWIENANGNDAWIAVTIALRPAGTGASLFRTADDGLGSADTADRLFAGFRTIADGITSADTATRATAASRDAVDSLAATDTATQTKNLLRTVADALARADVASRTLTLARAVADALGLADVATRQGSLARSATDAIARTDVATQIKNLLRAGADAVGLADVATRTGSFLRSSTDAVGQADAASRLGAFVRVAADAIARADVASQNITSPGNIARTAVDAVTRTDAVVRVVGLVRTVADALARGDAGTRTGTFSRSGADALSAADAASRTKGADRTAADALARVDVATRAIGLVRAGSDAVARSDVATRIGAFLRSVADALGRADASAGAVVGGDARGTVGAASAQLGALGAVAVLRDTVVIAYGPGASSGATAGTSGSVGATAAVRDGVGAGHD